MVTKVKNNKDEDQNKMGEKNVFALFIRLVYLHLVIVLPARR